MKEARGASAHLFLKLKLGPGFALLADVFLWSLLLCVDQDKNNKVN